MKFQNTSLVNFLWKFFFIQKVTYFQSRIWKLSKFFENLQEKYFEILWPGSE